MNHKEARIARIAFRLGTRAPWEKPVDIERFIQAFDEDKPCRYAEACVRTGRCPFDPCCNN